MTGEATYYAVFTATPIPQHEHEFTTFVRTVAATCVSGGYDEYVCECGMTEKRNETAADPSNHAKAAITVGARAATEEADGYTGDLICPACGVTITPEAASSRRPAAIRPPCTSMILRTCAPLRRPAAKRVTTNTPAPAA